MQLDFLRRRKAAIALAAAAAMTAGGIAHASLPTRVLYGGPYDAIPACYDQNRTVLVDPDWAGDPPRCESGMTGTYWQQGGQRGHQGWYGPEGDTGVKGDVGATGPQGPPGRNDVHWVITRPGQYDSGFRSSEPGIYVYSGPVGAKYIWISNRDINRCSIKVTAQAPGADGSTTTGDWTAPVVTGFFRYYGYIFAYSHKVVVNSSGQATTTPVATELNLIAVC